MLLLPEYSLSTLDTIHHMDALSLLRGLASGSVDAIITDPPYFEVKDAEWDNQWCSADEFIMWLNPIVAEYKRVLKSNGSLYLFTSSRMAARIEMLVSEHFNILNSIVWRKTGMTSMRNSPEALRAFIPSTERVIFAEHRQADKSYQSALIDGNSTYWQALERAKTSVFGVYLETERLQAGVSRRDIAALFPSRTGGMTGCYSNWVLGLNCPTKEQYERIRGLLNRCGDGEFLRREYEDLRREYEDLRREYEDLRRPFNTTKEDQYTDVWDFNSIPAYPGRHECEKPLDLMEHIIRISSRKGDVILDTFSGSGSTALAAKRLGRHYIGCDYNRHWSDYARRRLIETDPFKDTPLRDRRGNDLGIKQQSLFREMELALGE